MDADRFDEMTRALGTDTSRRGAVRMLVGGGLAAALARFGRGDAAAADDAETAAEGRGGVSGKDPPPTCRAGFRRCGQRCCRIPGPPPSPPANLARGAACATAAECGQEGEGIGRDTNGFPNQGRVCCGFAFGQCVADVECRGTLRCFVGSCSTGPPAI